MEKIKYIPLVLLFATGCGVGQGISTTQSDEWAGYDLFTTFPKQLETPQHVTFSSGLIEVDSGFYALQQFDMTLQQNPVDDNSIKLTIDVTTPDETKQRMTIYTTKDERRN